VSNMSAGDMFVPLGSEHACLKHKSDILRLSKTAKMLGGAVLAASVMLATRLQAKEADEKEPKDSSELDNQTTGSLPEESALDGAFGVEQILGSVSENDLSIAPLEVATLGNTSIFGNSASAEFASETGLPDGFVTPSPGVSNPSQETTEFPAELFETDQPLQPVRTAGSASGSQATPGENGIDGVDGENGVNGTDGQNGINGQDGADGETVLILDRELLESAGLLDILVERGIEIIGGPLDTIIARLGSDELDLLVELINSTLPEETDGGDYSPVIGTDQQDIIVGDEGDNIIEGRGGDDILTGGLGADTLVGDEGNDTASYIDSLQSVFIDLENERAEGGEAEGDQLLSIENLDGSNQNDRLFGDEVANILFGNGGEDILSGRGGADVISGGNGADFIDGGDTLQDTADYGTSDAGVTISLLEDTASGGHADGDELDNIEFLDGSFHDDFLQGDGLDNRLGGRNGSDVLFGEDGNDTLLGGNDGDIINGGAGIDTADYTASSEGVTVNLLSGETSGGEAAGDVLIDIENLAGSGHSDVLTGDNNDNRITGRDGDDTLIGNGGNDRLIGGEGADRLDGGEGNRDTADYSDAQSGIGVDLINGGFIGEADGDVFSGIEFVAGSQFDDVISGDDAINRLTGGEGNDQLFGREGNDTLIGGLGDDLLSGGEGNDVFTFDGETGNDTISDFEAGLGRTDRIWLQNDAFSEFSELQNSISQTDQGALITIDNGSTILLAGIRADELVADDFILA